MYNHQPQNYECPFCTFAKGGETPYNKRSDIIFEDEKSVAFISPKWWPNNPGHVIIIPKNHVENIYDIDDETLSYLYKKVKQICIAFKEVYQCNGTSTRQHNEPGGNQDMWHFHIHVFPRYENDELYLQQENSKMVTEEERKPYADKLRAYFNSKK